MGKHIKVKLFKKLLTLTIMGSNLGNFLPSHFVMHTFMYIHIQHFCDIFNITCASYYMNKRVIYDCRKLETTENIALNEAIQIGCILIT